MGLPPQQDGPPGPANGTFYDDSPGSLQNEAPAFSNGPAPRQRNGSTDPYPPQERAERSRNVSGEAEPKRKEQKRRPSGQQRTCGKCQQHLTGQFVRALGDTYHLECFTCHVSVCTT